MWKCSHLYHALLYGSPRVELVGRIYDELKEKWVSVHHMDVYIDGVEGLALHTFVFFLRVEHFLLLVCGFSCV